MAKNGNNDGHMSDIKLTKFYFVSFFICKFAYPSSAHQFTFA